MIEQVETLTQELLKVIRDIDRAREEKRKAQLAKDGAQAIIDTANAQLVILNTEYNEKKEALRLLLGA